MFPRRKNSSFPSYKKYKLRDVPGGPVVKNPLCSARDEGLLSGREFKILYATGLLSLRATTREFWAVMRDSRITQ